MRFGGGAFVALVVVAGCSSFSGSPDAVTPSGSDPDDGGAEASVVTGEPGDDTFSLDALAGPVSVIQGGTGKVTISVQRGQNLVEPITVTAMGFGEGITAKTMTITGNSNEMEFTAPPTAKQGTTVGSIQATANGRVLSTPVTVLVRGLPGTLDETFGTAGLADARDSTEGLAPIGLAVAADGSVYLPTAQILSSISYDVDFHFSSNGSPDNVYNTGVAGAVGSPTAGVLQPGGSLAIVGTSGDDTISRMAILASNGSKILSAATLAVPSSACRGQGTGIIDNAAVGAGSDIYIGWEILFGNAGTICTTHVDASATALTSSVLRAPSPRARDPSSPWRCGAIRSTPGPEIWCKFSRPLRGFRSSRPTALRAYRTRRSVSVRSLSRIRSAHNEISSPGSCSWRMAR